MRMLISISMFSQKNWSGKADGDDPFDREINYSELEFVV